MIKKNYILICFTAFIVAIIIPFGISVHADEVTMGKNKNFNNNVGSEILESLQKKKISGFRLGSCI